MTHGAEQGFTLIEALVAMAVLAVASAGLIRASEGHIDLLRDLQARSAAGWVAENRLVELRLDEGSSLPAMVEMLGQRWSVSVATASSADPDIQTLTVAVAEPGATRPLVTLRGFRDTGGGGR